MASFASSNSSRASARRSASASSPICALKDGARRLAPERREAPRRASRCSRRSDLQLTAKGTVRLDKKVTLDARLSRRGERSSNSSRTWCATVSPRPKTAARTIDFNVTGTTDKLKTNLLDKLIGQKINAQFGDLLGSLFGGDKKDEEEKKKKEEEERKKAEKKKTRRRRTRTRQARDQTQRPRPDAAADHVRRIREGHRRQRGRPHAAYSRKATCGPRWTSCKGAIFSSLGDFIVGARVLDLFAGSGALGIEALSRGAAAATFVESERRAVQAIEKNLANTKLSRRACTAMDVFRFLDRFAAPAQLRHHPRRSALRQGARRARLHARTARQRTAAAGARARRHLRARASARREAAAAATRGNASGKNATARPRWRSSALTTCHA